MPNSIIRDFNGPDFPLGNIANVTPGTPLNIMSLVDPTLGNSPQSQAPTLTGEYPIRAQQIIFQAVKAGVAHGTQNNTGNVYICRQGVGTGTGNRDDLGCQVKTLAPGETFVMAAAPLSQNVLNPYRYSIDADTAADGCQVTLLIMG